MFTFFPFYPSKLVHNFSQQILSQGHTELHKFVLHCSVINNFSLWGFMETYLKRQYHEMVCQLRPLVYSLGLNIAPRISFKLVKLRFK
jgi:hypothetical protein